MTKFRNAEGAVETPVNPEADAVFAKVLEDLKRYREAKSLEEARKGRAKKKGTKA